MSDHQVQKFFRRDLKGRGPAGRVLRYSEGAVPGWNFTGTALPKGSHGWPVLVRRTDNVDGPCYVLKRMPLGMNSIAEAVNHLRYVAEIRVMSCLQHDSVLRLTDFGYDEQGGIYYIAPYYSYGHLTLRTDAGQRLNASLRAGLEFFVQLCETLAYFHERGLIHGDVGRCNIFVTDDLKPIVADLSICQIHPQLWNPFAESIPAMDRIATLPALKPMPNGHIQEDESAWRRALSGEIQRLAGIFNWLTTIDPHYEQQRQHLTSKVARVMSKCRLETRKSFLQFCHAQAQDHQTLLQAAAALGSYARDLRDDIDSDAI